jgi:hypothetical protein
MDSVFNLVADYLVRFPEYHQGINAELLQHVYQELRPLNQISLRQTQASIQTVCFCDLCLEDEVLDVLKEMDRRSFLMNDIRWEFAMLCGTKSNVISEQQTELLFRCYLGEEATKKWTSFLSRRLTRSSLISLAEIEIILCSKENGFVDVEVESDQ